MPAHVPCPPCADGGETCIAPVETIVAELRAGRMVVLVDEEDRENEGDLVLAADCVTPQAINFMARYGRGLICLTLTREHCQRLQLPPMAAHNRAAHGTAFTVSIEAAAGVTTGISAADRARTVEVAVARDSRPQDLVQPGHIFPLQAADGGVLMRAGHTEAGCDLARMAGFSPASVICEIMNDDGSMARLPDLGVFARTHGLKIGTIADLIAYRHRTESLITCQQARDMDTPFGKFRLHVFTDHAGQGVHMALSLGEWLAEDEVLVRVHAPLSLIDVLEVGRHQHSWPLDESLKAIRKQGRGVAVLLNAGESSQDLLGRVCEAALVTAVGPESSSASRNYLRTYGIGAQILRHLGVVKMRLLGMPRKMPSMTGYGLEVSGFVEEPEEPSRNKSE